MTQPMPPPAPPQASDPAVLTDGTVVPREVPAAVGGGSFTVDLAHAPEALEQLESALASLKELRRDAVSLGSIRPTSTDQVSLDAAAVLGAVAVGGAGSFVDALEAGSARLKGLIDRLRADIESYGGAEGASQAAFTIESL